MSGERPNIVLIMTDQQRFDTISSLGFPYAITPNLDRLVAEGVSFGNSFVTAASCAPARASLFSGVYPHTNGVYRNADVWNHSWVELLAAGGYHCVNIGKMHTFPYETPLGFHERFVVENKDRYLEGRYFFDRWDMALQSRGLRKQQRELYRAYPDYGERLGAFTWDLPEDTHSDFFVGDTASWWIDHKPRTEPLFLQIGFPGPHPPYDPVRRFLDRYDGAAVPLPEVTRVELDAQPPAQKELRAHNTRIDHDSIAWTLDPSSEQLDRLRRHYLANVTMIDEKIGEILAALERGGYLENAVVIFTSDHGDCLGDHGHIQKWTMYDIVTRTPLIVWSPGRYPAGRRVDHLVQQIDIAPVILGLAGIGTPEYFETEDISPLLTGESEDPVRGYVYAEQARDPILTKPEMVTMVRDPDWKLVHYLGEAEGELYDLVNDPGEHDNLWNTPGLAGKKGEFLAELRDWRIRSSLRTARYSESWR